MQNLNTIYSMNYGVQRREALLIWIANQYDGLAVNRKWQANTCDPDIKILLKKGLLKRIRKSPSRPKKVKTSGSGQTYLVTDHQVPYIPKETDDD